MIPTDIVSTKAMKKHNHRIKYEFKKGQFPRGWRGDSWCIRCGETYFSREAMRMEMFGLVGILNPPNKKGDTAKADSAMFKVSKLTV